MPRGQSRPCKLERVLRIKRRGSRSLREWCRSANHLSKVEIAKSRVKIVRMSELLKEFRRRMSTLDNANVENTAGRVAAIYDWMEADPAIKSISDQLARQVDARKVFETQQTPGRIVANTREEIAFVGLNLAANCRTGAAFWRICASVGIRSPHGENEIGPINEIGLHHYIRPFLSYVEDRMVELNLDKLAGPLQRILVSNLEPTTPLIPSAPDVFISHSSRDETVAVALIRLIESAVQPVTIRCTSVAGYKFPTGVKFRDSLRLEVEHSTVFIALITPVSIRSAEVLFELGARWLTNRCLLPLLAAGATTDLMKGPLGLLQAANCADTTQITDLAKRVAEGMNRSFTPSPQFYGCLAPLTAANSELARSYRTNGHGDASAGA
jgi:hypothetical protein